MLRSIVLALLLIPGPVFAESQEQGQVRAQTQASTPTPAPTVEFTASEADSLKAMEETVPNEELIADEEPPVSEEVAAAAQAATLMCEVPAHEPTPLEIAKARARQAARAAGSNEVVYEEKVASAPQGTPQGAPRRTASVALDEAYEMKGRKLFLVRPDRRTASTDFQIRFKKRPKVRLKSN
jgi:hypothetical protein